MEKRIVTYVGSIALSHNSTLISQLLHTLDSITNVQMRVQLIILDELNRVTYFSSRVLAYIR